MGTKINSQQDKNSKYAFNVREVLRIIVDRALNPFKFYDTTFIFTKDYHKQKKMLRELHNYTQNVINHKLEQKIEENEGENNDFIKKKSAFLDLLLKYSNNGELLDLKQLRNEVDTFMFEVMFFN